MFGNPAENVRDEASEAALLLETIPPQCIIVYRLSPG
jgi:hypothetical protein